MAETTTRPLDVNQKTIGLQRFSFVYVTGYRHTEKEVRRGGKKSN